MVQADDMMLLSEIEGPKGKAVIYEITLPGERFEVRYKVVFEGQETEFPSMGEAHLHANEVVGIEGPLT
jgi:hypothetical protein